MFILLPWELSDPVKLSDVQASKCIAVLWSVMQAQINVSVRVKFVYCTLFFVAQVNRHLCSDPLRWRQWISSWTFSLKVNNRWGSNEFSVLLERILTGQSLTYSIYNRLKINYKLFSFVQNARTLLINLMVMLITTMHQSSVRKLLLCSVGKFIGSTYAVQYHKFWNI